ncbi:energy-coupling factor ABC transporter ATP-binding protein [Leucobacter sp. Z1108]|uniref:energy-coupling factor ABC transporter ATP-binding protein n=1 Tax=Leucobacter sp. Z1108 TaxID=3439066 RepID=UPI003F337772
MIELHDAAIVAPTHDGEVRVLEPTTLTLTEHRIALIGANGSGKSSLARLLNGLVLPTTGSVRVRAQSRATVPTGGSAIESGDNARRGSTDRTRPTGSAAEAARWLDTARDGRAVRQLVGFVFTNPATQLVMPTVIEDVALSLRRHHARKVDRLAAARNALARFGLEALADRSVHTLSGGQQQLLAIASVLATEPAILVADEPTTLLDLRNSRQISELLLGLPQQLIVATHDLELAARCDRVLVVAGGRVVHDSATAATSPAEAVDWYRERA